VRAMTEPEPAAPPILDPHALEQVGSASLDHGISVVTWAAAALEQERERLEATEAARLTETLLRIETIWRLFPSPILTLALRPGPTEPPAEDALHVEIGRFAHLGPLLGPSLEEQELAAGTKIRCALVVPRPTNDDARFALLPTRGYRPITPREVVRRVDFGSLIQALKTQTRAAAARLVAEQTELAARAAALEDRGAEGDLVPRRGETRSVGRHAWALRWNVGGRHPYPALSPLLALLVAGAISFPVVTPLLFLALLGLAAVLVTRLLWRLDH